MKIFVRNLKYYKKLLWAHLSNFYLRLRFEKSDRNYNEKLWVLLMHFSIFEDNLDLRNLRDTWKMMRNFLLLLHFKTRGPQALTVTWVSETLHRLLVRRAHICISRTPSLYFHYMTYMATPKHKYPCPWGHESYNFGRPFHGHPYYINFFFYVWKKRKTFLKKESF